MSELHSALTAAGDTTAPVIGLTYPDVILGDWVFPTGATNTDPGRRVGDGFRRADQPDPVGRLRTRPTSST